MSSQKSFYLTTPIYYVNSVPHLGTAYTTIAADALARYRRMCGDDVWFLTGLDEHGQKVEQAATENGVTPLEWADRMAAKFHEAWEMLNISNDDFIRTTEPRHEEGVRALLRTLHERGEIYGTTPARSAAATSSSSARTTTSSGSPPTRTGCSRSTRPTRTSSSPRLGETRCCPS